MSFSRFEDIEAWKASRLLSQKIYEITENGFSKDYSLIEQIRKSSGSVMDNIAEGFERGGTRELIQFLYNAKGSCAETRSQLYRAKDRNYITEGSFMQLKYDCEEISRMI